MKKRGYDKYRALNVPCPKCGVYERRLCVKENGAARKAFHVERHKAAAQYVTTPAKKAKRDYGPEWAMLRARVFAEKGADCVYCGQPAWHVDHQRPKCRGGTDDMSNLVPACSSCNVAKGSMTLEEWADVRK